jgi:hypothetical protein
VVITVEVVATTTKKTAAIHLRLVVTVVGMQLGVTEMGVVGAEAEEEGIAEEGEIPQREQAIIVKEALRRHQSIAMK